MPKEFSKFYEESNDKKFTITSSLTPSNANLHFKTMIHPKIREPNPSNNNNNKTRESRRTSEKEKKKKIGKEIDRLPPKG